VRGSVHSCARHDCITEAAGGASTRAAPSPLETIRAIARHIAAAGAASKRAASSQSLELQAARSARSVCGARSRSPTVRRRSNPKSSLVIIHTYVQSRRIGCYRACASLPYTAGCISVSPSPESGAAVRPPRCRACGKNTSDSSVVTAPRGGPSPSVNCHPPHVAASVCPFSSTRVSQLGSHFGPSAAAG
jgi:hypothetical protein